MVSLLLVCHGLWRYIWSVNLIYLYFSDHCAIWHPRSYYPRKTVDDCELPCMIFHLRIIFLCLEKDFIILSRLMCIRNCLIKILALSTYLFFSLGIVVRCIWMFQTSKLPKHLCTWWLSVHHRAVDKKKNTRLVFILFNLMEAEKMVLGIAHNISFFLLWFLLNTLCHDISQVI